MMTRILLPLLTACVALGASLPIGIPDPGWGLDETAPARPSPWTSEQAGYYFIDRAEAGATDSGRTYGYPGAARLTVPSSVPAGSYVEIAGAYLSNVKTITAAGTGDAWVANTAGPVWLVGCPTNQATFDDTTRLQGSYLYVEGLEFFNDKLGVGAETPTITVNLNGSPASAPHHVMIRDCSISGDGVQRTHGVSIYGTAGNVVSNVIVVSCIITNHGEMAAVADVDAFGIFAPAYSDSLWFLSNTVHSCVGSSIRMGSESTQPLTARRSYAGANTCYNIREHGIWWKVSADLVISGNTGYLTIEAPAGSPSAGIGAAIGGQYVSSNIWVINNLCYSNIVGVNIVGQDSGTAANEVHLIGNVLRDNAYGIVKGGSLDIYAINNTVSGFTTNGIYDYSTSRLLRLENNIVTGGTGTSTYEVRIQSNADSDTTILNDLIYRAAGERIGWGASTYTVAQLISNTTTGDGCLADDPLFVGAGNNALQVTSPCIGAALAPGSLTLNVWQTWTDRWGTDISTDIAGTARPQQTTWDIGAYEYQPGSRRATMGGGARLSNGRF